MWQVSQKLINVEVLIKHVVGKIFSKRIRKTPCLLKTSEYIKRKFSLTYNKQYNKLINISKDPNLSFNMLSEASHFSNQNYNRNPGCSP